MMLTVTNYLGVPLLEWTEIPIERFSLISQDMCFNLGRSLSLEWYSLVSKFPKKQAITIDFTFLSIRYPFFIFLA